MSRYGVLAARIQQELAQIQTTVAAAISQIEKAQRTGDRGYVQAAALSLQNFYMGVERIFEEIANQIDQSLPRGASSHRAFLDQMGLELPQTRPAVIHKGTLEQLNEYRGFRHVVMHPYGTDLKPDRLQALVVRLSACHSSFVQDIEAFCQFLRQLDQSL
jgi:hypothetical protein